MLWCSKHDLFPCDNGREPICLPAAVSCLQQKIRQTKLYLCRLDAFGVYPVNPDRRVLMRTDSAFSSHFSCDSEAALIAEMMVGGK